uniref:Uncharacterized protein n=1 Tax=Cacopsylla melanoneura TaxID=428564 RepID=A0A8D8TFG4_9HEMI
MEQNKLWGKYTQKEDEQKEEKGEGGREHSKRRKERGREKNKTSCGRGKLTKRKTTQKDILFFGEDRRRGEDNRQRRRYRQRRIKKTKILSLLEQSKRGGDG